MRSSFRAVLFSAALTIGGAALLPLPQTAVAATMPVSLLKSVSDNAETDRSIEKVYHKGRRHRRAKRNRRLNRRYDRRRHGSRYRHRRGHYKHFYGGYWYGVPWWLGSPYYATPYYDPYYDVVPVPRRSRHVDWCRRKYRSYNVRTDTFRGYDGYNHRCRSPYRR